MEITILRKGKGGYNSGDLLIKITKDEAQELKECGDNCQKQLSTFLDFLEKYSCNGSYFYFDASDFDNLSDAPCVGDRNFQSGAPKKFWFYSDYMVTHFTEVLRDHRETIFQKA
jgi:hypothetical protein